jgi:hypothetical protein
LALVVTAWPTLPKHLREAIILLLGSEYDP